MLSDFKRLGLVELWNLNARSLGSALNHTACNMSWILRDSWKVLTDNVVIVLGFRNVRNKVGFVLGLSGVFQDVVSNCVRRRLVVGAMN